MGITPGISPLAQFSQFEGCHMVAFVKRVGVLLLVIIAPALASCSKPSSNNNSSSSATVSAASAPAASVPSASPAGTSSPAIQPASAPSPTPIPATAGSQITSVTLFNSSGGSISNQPVTFELALATGDVPDGSQIQIRKSDGTTVVATQEDGCSKWGQDNSRAACSVSFVEPDTIAAGASATYTVFAASGSPASTPNLAVTDITAHTNIVLKTNNGGLIPSGGTGTIEAGTWDLLSLNYVLANCQQYSASGGYGANPRCGWEVSASGPNRYSIHAFQYARRESDSAVHNWIRTDMWVDFWGNSSTPCPCSVSAYVSQPNTFGPVSAGTVGGTVETSYVFGAQLVNGANVISTNLGGSSDGRVSSVTFDHTTGNVSFPAGGWTTKASGIFPVVFSSTGSLPSGLSSGVPYFFQTTSSSNVFQIYPMQCAPVANCGGGTAIAATSFADNGSGSITATPLTIISPFAGWMLADTSGQRYWIGSAGTATSPSPLLVGHDFTYLSQKSKATPPYIANLAGTMLPMSGEGAAYVYYPDSFYTPFSVDTTGDGPDDERIGYINRHGVISLMNPNDAVAYQDTMVIAASWQRMHMYHMDETVGLPVVMNNGPDKAAGHYPTLGADYPEERMYPYQSAPFMASSNAVADGEPVYESYGVWMEPSHMPLPQQVPFLKTGLPEWQYGMVEEAIATVSQQMFHHQSVGSNTYYRILDPVIACGNGDCSGGFVDNQTRGIAWGFRALDQAYHFEPSSSPLKPYLHDILADNVNFNDDVAVNVMTPPEQSLGYFWTDTHSGGNGLTQWWQDDFVFQSYAMNAWRGEFPHSVTFLTNYFFKQVITRMDPASTVGGGGCLWTGPSRQIYDYPASNPFQLANLPTTWNGLYTNNVAQGNDTTDWGTSAWKGCAAQTGGFILDYAGTKGQTPNGLISIMAASAAFGAILGIPDAASLYSTIRNMQYKQLCQSCTLPLSFSDIKYSGQDLSSPEFAFGPLGATN